MSVRDDCATDGAALLSTFRTPPPGYGEVPFWWWSGDPLDRDRLLWQLDQLHAAGIPGAQVNYAHEDTPGWPTIPAEPEVFSEQWWEIWTWLVGECRARGMRIGLSGYTLDWPGGGNLFGRLIYGDRSLNGSELSVASRVDVRAGKPVEIDVPEDTVLVRAYRVVADGTAGAVRLEPGGVDLIPPAAVGDGLGPAARSVVWSPTAGDWQVYVIVAATRPFTLDPLNPASGATVIDRFFSEFERRTPDGSSEGLDYFFQDELHFGVQGLLWHRDLPDRFRTEKGYDLADVLPALFDDVGPITPKARLDYADVKIALMEERYFRPIFEWHEARGMTYGCDPGGRGRDPGEFGDYFRAIRWYTAPGHDTPGGKADLIKGKVSSSIAHLYRRPRVWLEGYHSLGWGATPERLMRATCENYLYGCTLLNLHGLYYSTHGGFWEWAPPCYHFRMPYWRHLPAFLRYFERLSWLLTRGVHCCDIAVLYPVSPHQARSGEQAATEIAFAVVEQLVRAGYDLDFIDDESVCRAAKADGAMTVADESYRLLVIPGMTVVRWQVLLSAREFRRSGGTVIAVAPLPQASDRAGADDRELDSLIAEVLQSDGPGHGVVVQSASDVLPAVRRLARSHVESKSTVLSLHRRVGDDHVFMVMGPARGSECTFLATGPVALLDPWTGETSGVPAVAATTDTTTIRLPLEESEARVILIGPSAAAAHPMTHDAATGSSEAQPVEPIRLDGPWEFELEPTLDNQWGDFRLPATDDSIGPEARILRYHLEDDRTVDWRLPEYDDSGWERTTVDFGPRFMLLGPLTAGSLSAEEEAGIANRWLVDPSIPEVVAGAPRNWREYRFSWRMGVEGDPGHQGYHGLKEKITDEFICLGAPTAGLNETVYAEEPDGTSYYLWTSVAAGRPMAATVHAGGLLPAAVWVNGCAVTGVADGTTLPLARGANRLLLRYDRAGRGHFVLSASDGASGAPAPDARTPLSMSWFDLPGRLEFDVRPGRRSDGCPGEPRSAGWYRFTAPPGLRALSFVVSGEPEVWVDGKSRAVVPRRFCGSGPNEAREYRVELEEAVAPKSVVAIRVEHVAGRYAGAAFPEPVRLECGPGVTLLGDWAADSVLECYSGGARYRRRFTLPASYAGSELELDLGAVVATAEVLVNGHSVGTRVAPPWTFALHDEVVPGENVVEVVVYNTLANHYRTIPTRYRGPSLASGLLGPVTIADATQERSRG